MGRLEDLILDSARQFATDKELLDNIDPDLFELFLDVGVDKLNKPVFNLTVTVGDSVQVIKQFDMEKVLLDETIDCDFSSLLSKFAAITQILQDRILKS
jgi:hypothetical protein